MSPKHVSGEAMECPRCGSKMTARDVRRYETLVEHVSDPNREPSNKTGYGCSNPECEARDTRWLYNGEGPYGYWNPSWGRGADAYYPKGTLHHAIMRGQEIEGRARQLTPASPTDSATEARSAGDEA